MSIDVYDPSGLLIDTASPIDYSWGPNTGLIARYQSVPNPGWDGGVKIKDLCRRQADGTLTSMAFPPTTTSGWSRRTHRGGSGSISFDGTNDKIDLGAWTKTLFPTNFTVSYWCNPVSGNANGFIGFTNVTTNNTGWWHLYNGGNLLFDVGTGSTFSRITVAQPTVTKWTLVTVTLTAANQAVYYNGVSVGSHAGTTYQQSVGTGNLCWGAGGSTTAFFTGQMNDLRIWNRALSAREVFAVYLDALAGSPNSLNWMVDDDYIMPSSSPAPATSNAFWFAAP